MIRGEIQAGSGTHEDAVGQRLAHRLSRAWQSIKQILYGLTGYEFARHAVEMRREAEAVFIVVTMGDLMGVPILPPIYSLRILPHVVPEIASWKRRMARKREFWEKDEYDLHGV